MLERYKNGLRISLHLTSEKNKCSDAHINNMGFYEKISISLGNDIYDDENIEDMILHSFLVEYLCLFFEMEGLKINCPMEIRVKCKGKRKPKYHPKVSCVPFHETSILFDLLGKEVIEMIQIDKE